MAIQALSGINATSTRITNLPSPVAGSEPATKDFASSADNLASGTLAVARGGTGTGTYTNGQVLVGQTSGNTLSKVSVSGAVSLSNTGATTLKYAVISNGDTPANNPAGNGSDGTDWVNLYSQAGGSTSAASSTGGVGGDCTVLAGDGGLASGTTAAVGGAGGAVLIGGGVGGAAEVSGTGTNTTGAGGAVSISGGRGENVSVASTGTTTSGPGGAVTVSGGTGGISGGDGTRVAGAGGSLTLIGGTGGTLLDTGTGGNGGDVTVSGGEAGGHAGASAGTVTVTGGTASTTGTGGAGGAVTISGSNAGGDNTVNRNGGAVAINGGTAKGSGSGGAVNIASGAGGVGTGTTGGTGGALNVAAGSGGVGSATGGTGGQLNLKGGLGGDSTADGAGGDITLQVAATTSLGTKLKIVATTGQVQIINSDFKLGTYHTISSAGTSARTLTLPDATTTVVGHDTTQTLTNKRITKRVQSVTNAATITPNADSDDAVDITAIAQAFTIANPSGTPTNFQDLRIRIKDNGTARGITWGSNYVAGGTALPTTTVLSKILTLGFIYNTANSLNKWQCVASAQEA